jgi:hypothetical protein
MPLDRTDAVFGNPSAVDLETGISGHTSLARGDSISGVASAILLDMTLFGSPDEVGGAEEDLVVGELTWNGNPLVWNSQRLTWTI